MREVGFSLDEIGKIFKEGKTEEVLRRHLHHLLHQQQESYRLQKARVLVIKQLLSSKKESLINRLLDQIVSAYSPNSTPKEIDDLDDFLGKHHVVRGQIKPVVDFSQVAAFGFRNDFKVTDITYITYQGVFEENNLARASIALCKELYSYFILFSGSDQSFGTDFHRKILEQFSEQWRKVSWDLSLKFDALTEDIVSLERLFSLFDLAVSITAENKNKERINLVLPGQPLVVYLSQKAGVEYNTKEWLGNRTSMSDGMGFTPAARGAFAPLPLLFFWNCHGIRAEPRMALRGACFLIQVADIA
jgi:hypothetical protein